MQYSAKKAKISLNFFFKTLFFKIWTVYVKGGQKVKNKIECTLLLYIFRQQYLAFRDNTGVSSFEL